MRFLADEKNVKKDQIFEVFSKAIDFSEVLFTLKKKKFN